MAKLTAPDPGPVDDLIAAIVDEVHTQTQAQDRLRKRIRQLEQENAALKTAATAHQQQVRVIPDRGACLWVTGWFRHPRDLPRCLLPRGPGGSRQGLEVQQRSRRRRRRRA